MLTRENITIGETTVTSFLAMLMPTNANNIAANSNSSNSNIVSDPGQDEEDWLLELSDKASLSQDGW